CLFLLDKVVDEILDLYKPYCLVLLPSFLSVFLTQVIIYVFILLTFSPYKRPLSTILSINALVVFELLTLLLSIIATISFSSIVIFLPICKNIRSTPLL